MMLEESTNYGKLKPISASELLGKIKNNEPIEYDHVIIIGDIDIRKIYPENGDGSTKIDFPIKITNSQFKGDLIFYDTTFLRKLTLHNTIFDGYVSFGGAIFKEDANFAETIFRGEHVDFSGATFHKFAHFKGATFSGLTMFDHAIFHGWANFWVAKFNEGVNNNTGALFSTTVIFIGTTFKEAIFHDKAVYLGAIFLGDVDYRGAKFNKWLNLEQTQFNGDSLSFKNAHFSNPKSQAEACRKAKIVLERAGNRELADYHFYREMIAKRMQKRGHIRYTEYLIFQVIFGYGVHPFRLIGSVIAIIMSFSALYWISNSIMGDLTIYQYIWFSFTTAIIPGYSGFPLNSGALPLLLAGTQAIIGLFLWGTFIATFARKYMR